MTSGLAIGHDGGMAQSTEQPLVRNLVVGAVIGAMIGLVLGLVIHAIVGSGSLAIYEIVAGLVGLVLGALLGAFYGGALALGRRPTALSRTDPSVSRRVGRWRRRRSARCRAARRPRWRR